MSLILRTVALPVATGVPWDDFCWNDGKAPADVLDFILDARDWAAARGFNLDTVTATPSGGVAVEAIEISANVVTLVIGGGLPNSMAYVAVTLVFTGGRRLGVRVALPVRASVDGEDAVYVPPVTNPPPPGGTTPYTSMLAGAAISGHRALMFNGFGGVVHADPTSPTYAFAGISAQAATAAALVLAAEEGTMTEPTWSWAPSAPVYVGLAGALTQVPPSVGTLHQIGVAITATMILIQPLTPIIRH